MELQSDYKSLQVEGNSSDTSQKISRFNGNKSEYLEFVNRFKRHVLTKENNSVVSLSELIEQCSGRAKERIETCRYIDPPSRGLWVALYILQCHYGPQRNGCEP